MVVIAIIAILAGAITMGVNGMFYKSRYGRAKAMRSTLQGGLETYYARKGEWPRPIRTMIDSVKTDFVELSSTETDECFREIVKVSVGANGHPVLDPSGLFVMKNADQYCCTDIHKTWSAACDNHVWNRGDNPHKCSGKCPHGREFSEASKKGSKNRISVSEMSFGYPGPNHGRFCRYRLFYYPKSDTVRVYMQPATEHYCREHGNGYIDD